MRPRSILPARAFARIALVAALVAGLAFGAASPAVAETTPPTAPAIEPTEVPSPGDGPATSPAPAADDTVETAGSASLSGTVTSADAVAIGDVAVNAYRHNGDYFEHVSGTTTAADGTYAFEALEPGAFTLEFVPPYGSAYVGEWWNDRSAQWSADSFEIVGGEPLTGLDAVLALGGAVEGVVLGADGAQLSGAGVTAHLVTAGGGFEHRGTSWTGPDGTFRIGGLPAGEYTLEFTAPWSTAYAGEWWNDRPDRSSAEVFAIVAGETVSGLTAELSTGGSIAGVVTGDDAQPLAGVSVTANGPGSASALTDADGRYLLQGLAAGDYTVSFRPDSLGGGSASGYLDEYWDDATNMFEATPVAVAVGETIAGIDAELSRAGALSGVVAFDGRPIAGVQVSVSGAGWGFATTDADGRYEIPGLAAGTYNVWFTMPSGSPYRNGTAAVELTGGSGAVLDYTPERAASVGGRITADGSDSGVAGATVTLHAFSGAEAGTALTDADGRYTIAPVTAGRYLLEVTGPGIATTWSGGSPTRAGAQSFVVADATDVEQDVAADRGGSGSISGIVTVQTVDGIVPAQGASVELHSERGLVRTVSTDADGAYRFDGLEPVDYAVRFSERPWSATSWWWDGSARDTARFFEVGGESVVRDFTLPGHGWISSQITVDGAYTGYIRMEAVDPSSGDVLASSTSVDGAMHTLFEVPAQAVKLRFTGPIRDTWWGGSSFADAATINVPIGGEARADVSLSIDGVLAGTVFGVDGAPVPGASFTVAAVDGANTFWTTADASGSYRITGLEPGGYRVTVPGGPVGVAESVVVEIADGAGTTIHDVRLEAPVHLTGTVTHLGQAIKSCVGISEIGAPRLEPSCTDASGGYEHWLLPGDYVVSFRPMVDVGAAGELQQLSIAPGGGTTLTLDADLERGGIIEGRVTADLGNGVEPVSAHWVRASEGGVYAASAETGADGSYRLWGLRNGVPHTIVFGNPWNDLGMEWWEDATAPGASTAVTPGPDPVTGIDAELVRGAALSGRVTDADGLGASFADVAAYSAAGDLLGEVQADQQGAYQFNGLPAGPVLVRYVPSARWTPGHLPEWWRDAGSAASGAAVTVELGSETAGIDAELNRVGTVPVEMSAPEVSGTPRVGERLTAVATATTDGATLAFEWLADGAPIAGATSGTLDLAPEMLGKRIAVRATAAAVGYVPTTSTSEETDPVEAAGVDPAAPRITGTTVVGARLRVDAGPKAAGTTFAYRWLADGMPLAGATKSSLRLTEAHLGARIQVRVTTLRGGVALEQRISAPTDPVTAAAATAGRGSAANG